MRFRNAAEAFVGKLAEIGENGTIVNVRGSLTREICHQFLTLEHPLERCIVVPGRRNNVFAAIAETVWVLAGRNDLAFLSHYLPRAANFSDDAGVTWRAGYGPRLRSWRGSLDQLAQVVRLLGESESTRRAVISLFDPSDDFQDSNDVPCTNWLHFTVRNGAVDLSVAVRSNDLVWGFSGINTFEWSVLQEMVAYWLGRTVGVASYFISSLHVYERHFDRANEILKGRSDEVYEQSPTIRFATAFDDLSSCLAEWFRLEEAIRNGSATMPSVLAFRDPLLRDFLAMLAAFWAFQSGNYAEAQRLLMDVQDSGLVAAGESYFEWKSSPAERAETP